MMVLPKSENAERLERGSSLRAEKDASLICVKWKRQGQEHLRLHTYTLIYS